MSPYTQPIPEITLKFKTGETKKVKIDSSQTSYDLFKELFDSDTLELYEQVICLFLNRACNTIGWFKVSQGGITGTIIDIRLILVTALKCGATNIILAHNHPSGKAEPSPQDINITNKLSSGCKTLEINLLDHIIVTNDRYYSFADNGLINY